MNFCHGKGNTQTDGCCWVAGAPCPLRLKVVDGRVLEGPDLTDRGTVTELANTLGSSGAARTRAKDLLTGVNIACRAAVEILTATPRFLSDRPGFEAAWDTHAAYVAQVRPHWEAVEDDLGLERGEYQCSTWQGTGGDQCCFAETEVENTSKRQNLSSTAVAIRQAGGRS